MDGYVPRMGQDRRVKKYVTVVAEFDPEGSVKPLWIVWDTGVKYEIERIYEARQAHSLKTGGTGIRYKVRVGNQVTYLWYEGPAWFVESKDCTYDEWEAC